MHILSEDQIVRATSAGFVPSSLNMQGFVEQFGLSLSKEDHWKGSVARFKGTGADWGVCSHCLIEIEPFFDSHLSAKVSGPAVPSIDDGTRKKEDAILQAVSEGKRVLAMKLYRELHGATIQEARLFVDELDEGDSIETPGQSAPPVSTTTGTNADTGVPEIIVRKKTRTKAWWQFWR